MSENHQTRRRNTNACNPVDKPARNNGEDRLISLLKKRCNNPNQHGHGSSTLSLFYFPEEYCVQHLPHLGDALLGNVLHFSKDLLRDVWHKIVVDLLPCALGNALLKNVLGCFEGSLSRHQTVVDLLSNRVSTLKNVITTLCSHTLTKAFMTNLHDPLLEHTLFDGASNALPRGRPHHFNGLLHDLRSWLIHNLLHDSFRPRLLRNPSDHANQNFHDLLQSASNIRTYSTISNMTCRKSTSTCRALVRSTMRSWGVSLISSKISFAMRGARPSSRISVVTRGTKSSSNCLCARKCASGECP